MRRVPIGHGPNKNELLLRRAQQFNDPTKLATVVANYTFGSSFFYRISNFEGEEVFGFVKRFVDCPFGGDNDYHRFNHMNFSCSRVIIHVAQPNVVGNVGM